MSYLNFSRSPNFQNLTHKEFIDVIKKNEYYSGCYSIIQEKNLKGQDILNITENTLAAWKLPPWLTKKLLSLKETLSRNPESLLVEEDENINDDPRKTISNTLTSIFKNKQKPLKIPISESSPIKKEADVDLIYDDDNYLKPKFNSIRRQNHELKFQASTLKPLEIVRSPSRKNNDAPSVHTRKPVALPRPDFDEEENEYEPAPRQRSKLNKTISKLPLPPPPADETDEYEPPPRLKPKQSEAVQEEDYEYIETKNEEKPKNRKTSTTKFYVDEFPPPLPERSYISKTEVKKWLIPPVYSNVDNSPTPTGDALPQNRTRKITPKLASSTSPVTVESRKTDSKTRWSAFSRPLPPLPSSQDETAKVPVQTQNEEDTYENTPSEPNEIDDTAEYGNVDELPIFSFKANRNSEIKSKTPKDHREDLKSHLSNFKLKPSTLPKSKQSNIDDKSRELQEKLEKRLGNKESKETANSAKSKKDVSLLKSKMKLPLPPTSIPQTFRATYFDEQENDNNENEESGEDLPEYLNSTDAKTKPSAWKSQPQVTSPISQLAIEISQRKLKSISPKREIASSNFGLNENPITAEGHSIWNQNQESDFEDDQEEDLPEYSNTTDAPINEPRVKKIDHPTQPLSDLSSQILKVKLKSTPKKDIHPNDKPVDEPRLKKIDHPTQPVSELSSQISKVKLTAAPKKDIHLNDKLADELRFLLQRRKGSTENVENPRGPWDTTPRNNLPSKPSQKSNYQDTESEPSDDSEELEQENYDVAGSYNILNFNNEPFYRNTDRKGAIALLRDLENGAFLLRPSSKFFLSITIKNNGKYFNLGIEKTTNNKIFCGEGMMRTKEFFSVHQFLEYFESNPLILQGEKGLEEVYLKRILPLDRF